MSRLVAESRNSREGRIAGLLARGAIRSGAQQGPPDVPELQKPRGQQRHSDLSAPPAQGGVDAR